MPVKREYSQICYMILGSPYWWVWAVLFRVPRTTLLALFNNRSTCISYWKYIPNQVPAYNWLGREGNQGATHSLPHPANFLG